jgi:hypothetical protein
MSAVLGATHDGASNMKLDSYPTVVELDCGTHTAQLIITDLYGRKDKSARAARAAGGAAAQSAFEKVRDPGHALAVAMRSSPLKRDLLAATMKTSGADPKTVFLAPDHRWSYDYLEQKRLSEIFPFIKMIKLAEISDKASERNDFDQLRIDYEVRGVGP